MALTLIAGKMPDMNGWKREGRQWKEVITGRMTLKKEPSNDFRL